MGKSIRIKTTPGGGDKYVSLNIEQDFDFLEVLSVKIRQDDVYRRFCSDYGVVVGRVILNDGFGAPNAKVSVFIPLDEEDEDNTLITSIYPYKSVTDTDSEFVRYNLLPEDKQNQFHKPVGTFPSKRKVLNNDVYLDVYNKYYKFTTTTNQAGDFMLFGVPVGQQTIHFDLDLSDMGDLSLTPADLISSGVNENEFQSETIGEGINTYQFKVSNSLDLLPQIKNTNIDVDVQPFWGDSEQCQIGITRLDWKVPGEIVPSAIIFGCAFFDTIDARLGKDFSKCDRNDNGNFKKGMRTNQGLVECLYLTENGFSTIYSEIHSDGNWDVILPMRQGLVKTNEDGSVVVSTDGKGIATYADYRFRFSIEENENYPNSKNAKGYLLMPQYTKPQSLSEDDFYEFNQTPYSVSQSVINSPNDQFGFKEQEYDNFYRFRAGKIYTTRQLIANNYSNNLNTNSVMVRTNQGPTNINAFPANVSFSSNFGDSFADSYVNGCIYFCQFNMRNDYRHCEDLVWGKNASGTGNNQNIGESESTPPYYYKTDINGATRIKNLTEINNSGFNYFTTKNYANLPLGLPQTSADGNTVPTTWDNQPNSPSYADSEFYYFGINKGNTSLDLVKEKYNV